MEEEKKSAIVDLDALDKKIAEQTQRLEKQQAQEAEQRQLEAEMPWTNKMQAVFQENIMKSLKCGACGWMNVGQKLIMMNRIQILREALPVITVICKQCGGLFVPKWCRKVLNQAIEKENRLMKERALRRGEVDPDETVR